MAQLTLLFLMDHRPWQMAEVEVNLAQPEPFTLLGNPVLPPLNIINLLHVTPVNEETLDYAFWHWGACWKGRFRLGKC